MKIAIILLGALFLAGARYPASEIVAGQYVPGIKGLYINGYRETENV